MESAAAWRRNRVKLTVLKAGTSSLFYLPILVVFLQQSGMSLFEVLIMQGISALVLASWQIPSGYLADRWGRKNTLIAGAVCNFIGVLCYCIGTNYWFFLAATSLLSTGLSFQSGTIEALTFESLEAEGKAQSFRRSLGSQTFMRFAAEALAGLIGGALAVISLRLAFWATLPVFGALIVLAMTLDEPPRTTLSRGQKALNTMLAVAHRSLIGDKRLRYVILIDSLFGSLLITLYWFTQPYLVEAGVPLGYFGAVHAAVVLSAAIASRESYRFAHWLKDRQFLLFIAISAVSFLLLLGVLPPAPAGIALIILVRVMWGFLGPLTFDLMNRMTTPDVRATILSVRGFMFQIFFAFFPPVFAAIADRTSLSTSLIMHGLFTGCCIAVLLKLMRPLWKKIPKEIGMETLGTLVQPVTPTV